MCLQAESAPLAQTSPQSISQKLSGKYPKVQELLLGKRARCYLLPAPERQWSSKGQASPRGSKCSRGGDLSGIASKVWPSLSLAQALQSEESLFSDTEDDLSHFFRAYISDVLSTAPQHAKSRCQGYWSEGRAIARGDRRLLTGQQLAQEIKVCKLPRESGLSRQAPAFPDLAVMSL